MSNNPDSNDRKVLLKNALLALDEMQSRLDAVEQSRTEPIAVVGIGCRFPGGADSPEAYWKLLWDGGDAIREVPPGRWNTADYDNLNVAWYGGFLDEIDHFDPQFFGIAPREAASLDPQQRLVLEVGWEALENAGQAPDKLAGSQTGVFMGITTNDYAQLVKQANPTDMDIYSATGTAMNAAAGRLAYTLGLQGPCMAIDTACSSSLVAIHLAMQSLRNGECNMAIAGGVNATLAPENFVCFAGWGMMAPDGRCKTFDASANGFVRGEGCGIVVLKRLSDAQAQGDNILAVLRGSAVNQDGRSSGLTVPNGPAQQEVVRKALENAHVKASEIGYIEAHGTGTAIGDPIEVEALGAVLGQGRHKDQPLIIGSVKTNLGHLESAAGVAGLIKVILSLQHSTIPQHLHFQEPSSRIPWPEFPVIVPTEHIPWPAGQGRRLAGVSAFGFSGTNAHIIIEEAPSRPVQTSEVDRPVHILSFSAKSETALRELAGRYASHLSEYPAEPANVAFTSNSGRADLSHRAAVIAETAEEMRDQLASMASGQEALQIINGVVNTSEQPRIAFIFTGQGSQYVDMGWELYRTQPTFRDALNKCDELLRPYLEHPLLTVLYPEDGISPVLDHTTYTQPALFALEYALATLWQSWGIEPAAVMGHSIGEYVAACIAGVFSLEDGLKLIAARGRLMGALPEGGKMAAVFADESTVATALHPYRKEVSIAAINGPKNIVISGAGQAVEAILASLGAQDIKSQPLKVSHGFHSPLMDSILNEFEEIAKGVHFSKPRIRLLSNVTGQLADVSIQTAAYWRRHIRDSVRFGDSITTLYEKGINTFLEIGPGVTLLGMGQRCLQNTDESILWLPSLRSGQPEWGQMLGSLGLLYIHGAKVDWAGFDQDYPRQRIPLPTYPFQRERYWVTLPKTAPVGGRVSQSGGHPLIGQALRSPLIKETLFETSVSAEYPAFLLDHQVYGAVVFPGTGYIEMALAAGMTLGKGAQTIENLTIQEALILPDEGERVLQLVLTPQAQGGEFQILSLEGGISLPATSWKPHATGQISGGVTLSPASPSLHDIQSQSREFVPVEIYYQQLRDGGLNYGETFRCITELWVNTENHDVLGHIQINDDIATGYYLFPGLLDSCFQLLGAMMPSDGDVYLPIIIDQFRFTGNPMTDVWAYASLRGDDLHGETLVGDLWLFDQDGEVIAELEGLHLKRIQRHTLERLMRPNYNDLLYETAWQSESLPDANLSAIGNWLILADRDGLGEQLAAELETHGANHCDIVLMADLEAFNPAKYDALLTNRDYRDVIYLWALDTTAADNDIDVANNAYLLYLIQAMARRKENVSRLTLVTRKVHRIEGEGRLSVEQSPLWGFGRVIALEHPGLWGKLIDLDDNTPTDVLVREVLVASEDTQVAIRGKQRYAARLSHQTSKQPFPTGTPIELIIPTPGILDNLELRPLARRAPAPGEVEVQVYATGLNFRDVLNVLGMYPGVAPLGNECAGVITALGDGVTGFSVGDEVIALAGGTFKSYVTTTVDQVFYKPGNLSFADAVSIPTTFLTAYFGLNHLAKLSPGQRVLIHSAAGGVGLAAVQLALRAGAEIFATAGSPNKRAYLQSLGVHHVMNSRTLDFADEIVAITGGEGVDVVLNSLSDDFIPKSLSILAENGTFLEIGKRGVWEAEQVAAAYPTLSYYIYDLVTVLEEDPDVIWSSLHQLLADFTNEELQPLPTQTFSIYEAADAFRFMAQAKHIGKIVITHNPHQVNEAVIQPDATYLITGGLGGLGLQVAGWMVETGALHLVLVGRSGISQTASDRIQAWQQSGVQVDVVQADVASIEQIESVIAAINQEMPPLRGVIHAAGVLDDGLLINQDWPRFESVFAPKIRGAWNLHLLTQNMRLDFFTLFSAGAALLGSSGQANYAAANAFLDGLAHYRRSQGLPALSINWGAWAEVGMAAEMDETYRQNLSAQGINFIQPAQGLAILEQLIAQDTAQTAVLPINWTKMAAQFSAGKIPDFLSNVMELAPAQTVGTAKSGSEPKLLWQLEMAPPDEKHELLVTAVRDQVVKVLGLNPAKPPELRQGLTEIGMDSLMAVELSNRLKALLGQPLPATLAFEYPSIYTLVDYLENQVLVSVVEPEQAQPAADPTEAGIMAELEALSDNEIEATLLDELKKAGY